MFKKLSTGIKISITRSITITFENYMKEIRWDENKYRLEDFVIQWREYITETSSWYSKIDDSLKADPTFHEQLAAKINETLGKLLSEPPTKEQLEQLAHIEEESGKKCDYSCKAEAAFIIESQENK